MSGPELKPCPFCGAKAHMLGGPDAQETYSVWCKSKGRRHHVYGTMDANQTAAIWNTRADLPPTLAAALAVPEIAAQTAMLREMARGLKMVHDALADGSRPRQSVGEVAAWWVRYADQCLAALAGKGE